ncbi:MAG: glycosyltransferase [Muribaculaceae bacterium]|nr:glycosyltransferase [Muribaculaceae bacterium]
MISIIIPVYNSEKYLEETIESVYSQTFCDWELILVDDGSTDRSGELCEKAAILNPKTRVVHKKNGGLSSARNAGITAAKGSCLLFLDSDDLLPPVALELLSKKMADSGSDIVCGNIHNFRSSANLLGSHNFMKSIPGQIGIKTFTPVKALEKILYQKTINNSVCGKLFSKNLFREVRFREGTGYEDLDIISPLVLEATKISVIALPLYHYRQHQESYIHTFSMKRCDVLEVTRKMVDYMACNCPRLLPAARSRQLSANFNILGLIAANRNHIKERGLSEEAGRIACDCWNKIKELRGESLRNPSVRLKNKTGILASYLGGRPLTEAIGKMIYR